ncbi:MAG: UDP-N-acetylenolpyruvoylglucosamine reductase, partial [Firmicutes bacterium]|nr:UDP-N-acetylenolpyruvoylglucosamine reductase [Bacillota bacterium]
GTVGGAAVMNAGAFGGDTAGVLSEVTVYDPGSDKIYPIKAADCGFGYRRSRFQGSGLIVLGAVFKLQPGDKDGIKARTEELARRRKETQPGGPSAGSVFRRPDGSGKSAGWYIERCGLKGAREGGAEVSALHANFILNTGGATAENIRVLVEKIQKIVYNEFGILLEPEIEFC